MWNNNMVSKSIAMYVPSVELYLGVGALVGPQLMDSQREGFSRIYIEINVDQKKVSTRLNESILLSAPMVRRLIINKIPV
jgi:hypothetical protein